MANRMQTTSERSLERFLKALDQTSTIVKGIREEQWHNATPCAEWDLRVLVNHVIGENRWLSAIFGGETVASVGSALDGDLTGDDPIATYLATAEAARASITPALLEAHHDVSIGDISGYDYLNQLFMDQYVHGWDILKGSHQDIALDDDLAGLAVPVAQEMIAYVGQGSVFGTTLEMDPSISQLARLLGTVGRSVDWQPPEGAISK